MDYFKVFPHFSSFEFLLYFAWFLLWKPSPLWFMFPSIIYKSNVTLLQRHLWGTSAIALSQAEQTPTQILSNLPLGS